MEKWPFVGLMKKQIMVFQILTYSRTLIYGATVNNIMTPHIQLRLPSQITPRFHADGRPSETLLVNINNICTATAKTGSMYSIWGRARSSKATCILEGQLSITSVHFVRKAPTLAQQLAILLWTDLDTVSSQS